MGIFDKLFGKKKARARKKKGVPEGYFECDVPPGDGRCSDNACPCGYPGTEIPRGTGYLYIEQDLVDFRRQCPTLQSARKAMERIHKQGQARFGGAVITIYRLGPILVCEKGAKLRGLDLEVAAADAKQWWKTGLVPLRATPLSKEKIRRARGSKK